MVWVIVGLVVSVAYLFVGLMTASFEGRWRYVFTWPTVFFPDRW